MSSKINTISSFECLDSRGFPTIHTTVSLENGSSGSSLVPSGASTGAFEAHELRDTDKSRYLGKGVTKAVNFINSEINSKIKGLDCLDQENIDNSLISLDGTENKSRLGANSILGVSLACSRAAANYKQLPLCSYLNPTNEFRLPIPLVNVINGGAHAANSIDFQEFMLVPHFSDSFSENIRAAAEVFHNLKKILVKNNFATGLGDEGGFAPNLKSADQACKLLIQAIEQAGYKPESEISLALDVAASEFYNKDNKTYKVENNDYSSSDLINLYKDLSTKYPIVSIEDGFDEEDWDAWSKMQAACGDKIQLVGDDLFVTNIKRLSQGIEHKSANSILIKLNQIGTLTETLSTINLAKENNYSFIISHRSGETEDTFIADLAAASHSGQIKTGSTARSERVAKYNRLIWIENNFKNSCTCINPFKN